MTRLTTLTVNGFQGKYVVKGFIWTLIITITLGILLSLILQFTPLSESLLAGLATFIFFISMLLGASIGARAAGNKGLLHGLAVCLSYWVLTLLVGLCWSPDIFTLYLIFKRLGFAVLSGVLGGIIGIGLSNR